MVIHYLEPKKESPESKKSANTGSKPPGALFLKPRTKSLVTRKKNGLHWKFGAHFFYMFRVFRRFSWVRRPTYKICNAKVSIFRVGNRRFPFSCILRINFCQICWPCWRRLHKSRFPQPTAPLWLMMQLLQYLSGVIPWTPQLWWILWRGWK